MLGKPSASDLSLERGTNGFSARCQEMLLVRFLALQNLVVLCTMSLTTRSTPDSRELNVVLQHAKC